MLNIYQNSHIDPIQLDYVSIDNGEKQNLVCKGDVLFTVSSETADEVGISSVLLEDLGECYLNSFCFGWRPSKKNLLPDYLEHYFRSAIFRKLVLRLSQGATRYNLSKNELMKLNIPVPSINAQRQIALTLNSAKSEIDILRQIVKNYKEQKQGLMQKLLTGKWRVKVK